MTVTEQDIKNLTPEHRVVWKYPAAPRGVEMGLWVDGGGHLCVDTGGVVRWEGGTVSASILDRIVRIIEPAFTPRRGLAIGHPEGGLARLVCFGPDEWYGYAPVFGGLGAFNSDAARNLIKSHGWVVMDDLTKEKSND